MNRIFLFLSMLLLLNVSKVSSCFAGDNDPIGSWHAPRHCYANDEAYREARRQRREAEDRWIQRNREREREQNRRNRRTKKLLKVPKTEPIAVKKVSDSKDVIRSKTRIVKE